MIIAITGGRGFIGRKLVDWHLEAGDTVRVLSRRQVAGAPLQNVECHHADLTAPKADALLRFVDGASVLYHCAGELSDSGKMDAVNHLGTARLAEMATGRIGRWVQLSTIGVYGSPGSGTVVENSPVRPPNAYEMSKLQGDRALAAAADGKGMAWCALRPSIVFGNGMPNMSVRGLIDAIRRGRFFYIGVPGAILPYVHVDDVAEALLLLGRHHDAPNQVFNLSDDVTLEDFANEVSDRTGCRRPSLRLPEFPVRLAASLLQGIPRFPLTASRIDALTRRTRYSTAKIQAVLGYSPTKGWRAGLQEMLSAAEPPTARVASQTPR